jgi:hypothetical protein
VAGSFAGGVGQLVGYPLDTLKVHYQLGLERQSFFSRWRSLFRGCLIPVATAGVIQSINFGVYDACRLRLLKTIADPNARGQGGYGTRGSAGLAIDTPLPVCAAAAAAGGVTIAPLMCA